MALKDLKHIEPAEKHFLAPEPLPFAQKKFIWRYGYQNCHYLKFKSFDEVMKALEAEYPNEEFTQESIKFVKKNENKEVLCYIPLLDLPSYSPDIFVCGDDNIAFVTKCFV